MNVRWTAVLTGFLVDTTISLFLFLFADPDFATSVDLTRPNHLILLCLLTLSTAVGGYVSGRMAQVDRTLHGLLVPVVGILLNQLSPAPPMQRVVVIATAISCLLAALGGFLSRYPALRQPQA